MFLEPDDYLILMNIPLYSGIGKPIRLVGDDIKRLRDVGIKTVLEYPWWDAIEHTFGQRDYRMIEDFIVNARQGGMKVVMPVPTIASQGLPREWYCHFRSEHPHMERTSLWQPGAVQYEREYLLDLVTRFSASDVIFVYSGYLTGESVLNNAPCYFDSGAMAEQQALGLVNVDVTTNPEAKEWLRMSILRHYKGVQDILRKQHNEIWDAHQWCIAQQSLHNGNFAQEDWLKDWRQSWPDVSIVLLQYTCFAHNEPYPTFVKNLMDEVGLRVIVEADYCRGVKVTSRVAKEERGYHGNVIGPVHPWAGETELKPWMVDTIREVIEYWGKE